MLTSLFILVFYFVYLFIYKDKTYYYIYHLCVLLFGAFLCTKVEPATSSYVHHVIAIGMLLPIIPYLRKYFRFILVSFAILIVYILLKIVGWHIDAIRMFMDLRISIYAVCFGLSMVENIKSDLLDMKRMVKWIYILVFIQIALAIFQYLVPSSGGFFVAVNEDSGLDAAGKAIKLNMTIITGTLMTPAALAGLIVVSLFVLITYELENKSVTFPKVLFVFLSIAVAFLTGIRTPFIFFLLFTSLYFFFYQRKLFYSFLPIFALIIIAFVTSVTISQEGAVGRMLDGFGQAFSGREGLEETTLGLSFVMIPYFLQNPLFGISLGINNYYIIGGYVLADFSTTDVYLMYILCEYGLLGLLVFLYPFFRFRTMSEKVNNSPVIVKKATVLLYVAFGICLSIVDKGIFHYQELVLLIIGIILFSNNTQNKRIVARTAARYDNATNES